RTSSSFPACTSSPTACCRRSRRSAPRSPPLPQPAELFDVTGHSVIVTGAASGLGLAIAEVFRDAGATVTALDIDEVGLARLDGMRTQQLDVADLTALQTAVEETAA